MMQSINAQLVENALQQRSLLAKSLQASVASTDSTLEKRAASLPLLEPYARALDHVNKHITIRPHDIKAAVESYGDIAQRLVDRLHWPVDAIEIFAQGSASTKTLIRSPDRTKFDIDAVCRVAIDGAYASDPIKFFEDVGKGLEGLDVKRKNRCWMIQFANKPYYIEFTPSVPLDVVALDSNGLDRRRLLAPNYRDTALAVVDRESEKWKTSNPQGLVQWVDDASKLQLVRTIIMDSAGQAIAASVGLVPEQEIGVDDTLRIAIRFFKRHRDMYVRRGHIEAEFQPISVILVTLLTRCYYGLSELGLSYRHALQVLVEMATLLPHLVYKDSAYGYFVQNPTVEGENFAERWNRDAGERARTFEVWCGLLCADLKSILVLTDERAIEAKTREIFGCTNDDGSSGSDGGGGGIPLSPSHRPPPPPPRTTGLA